MNRLALERFAAAIRRDFHAERLLLFGSRVRGQSRPSSDYDMIIVSPDFASKSRRERPVALYRLWYESGGDAPVDLICLTPDEFDDAAARISLVASVLPESVDLLASDANDRLDSISMVEQVGQPTVEPEIVQFAELLRSEIAAERVLLYGSRARGAPVADDDYDFMIVSPMFANTSPWRRGIGLRQLFYQVHEPASVDLTCLTPDEFERGRTGATLVAAILPEAIELLR